jgi:oligoendopeptidase F
MINLNTTKVTWDLSKLYSSDNDPQMAADRKKIAKANSDFANKWRDREDYLTDPKILKEALDELDAINQELGNSGKIGYYYHLRTSQDQIDPQLKAKDNLVSDFAKKIYNEIQFFMLRVAKIDEKLQPNFLEYEGLDPYRHFLEREFSTAKHNLTEPEEKILVLVNKPAYENWVQMTDEFISKEEQQVLTKTGRKKQTFEELIGLMNSQDKKIRDSAAEGFNKAINNNVGVATKELNSILEFKKITDHLRNFQSPEEDRLLNDDVEQEVVDALVTTVTEKLDISKRFYELKSKLLDVPRLAYHERNVPYGSLKKEYSYQEAVDLVYKVFGDLDSEFASIFKEFVENGQIDVYPKKGKGGGAFCTHNLISHPTYILLNFKKNFSDIDTLAHEAGHGINNELIKKTQNATNFGTPLATAEVASTFMEDFVLRELLKTATEEERLAIQVEKLNRDVSSVIRQVSFYLFERELHREYREKGYLSNEDIGTLFQQYMSSYMGEFVEQSPGSENWWVYVGHFRSPFYVYSYASGLLISKSLQAGVRQDKDFISKVKEFLSAGLSDSPKNIFAKMDIDITNKKFWEKGLGEIENLLDDSEALAKKLNKIS